MLRPRFDLAKLCALTIALTLATPTSASGADTSDADGLIRDGIALRRKREDQAALKLFQKAYEVENTPRAMAQIGFAEQALGRWATADKHLRQAVQSGQNSSDPWIRKNRASIDDALVVVSKHVGQVDVTGTPDGAEIRVDGELAGRLPLPGPITATVGGVAVEVRAPGYLSVLRSTTVTAGGLTRESFNLQSVSPAVDAASRQTAKPGEPAAAAAKSPASNSSPPPAAATSPAGGVADGAAVQPSGAIPPAPGTSAVSDSGASPAIAGSTLPIVMAVAGGLSALSLAFGVYEHLAWQNKVSSFKSMLGCDTELKDRGASGCAQLYGDGETAKTRMYVGYSLAAGFAITAAILYLTNPGHDAKPQQVACGIAPLTTGFRCALTF